MHSISRYLLYVTLQESMTQKVSHCVAKVTLINTHPRANLTLAVTGMSASIPG